MTTRWREGGSSTRGEEFRPRPRLGVAITTYNRAPMLAHLLHEIERLSSEPCFVVVCDDGSSDDTAEVARTAAATCVSGENRGVAWNKNRGLFYLLNYTSVEYILLLDDDVLPFFFGWEQEWINGLSQFGHLNHALVSTDEFTRGPRLFSGSQPGLNPQLSGVALGFHRRVLAQVGYMDTRFGRYGHEHTELTLRAVRCGYGGLMDEQPYFLVIRGGLRSLDPPSHGGAEHAEDNQAVFDRICDEPPYRLPWRNEEERLLLVGEMERADPGPMRHDTSVALHYLAQNPDVTGGAATALIHWLEFGRLEGRPWPRAG